MRSLVFLLPLALFAQTPPPKAPAPATKAPATKAPATTQPPAAPKPAGTTPGTATAPRPAAPRPAVAAAPLTTDDQKTIYSLGLIMAQNLASFDLSPAELDLVKRALSDAAAKKPAVKLEEWGPKIQGFATARAARVAEKTKLASSAFLTKAAVDPGAVKCDSGLIYKELRPGTGPSPQATDQVKVHYRGTLTDGTEFDSSYKRNEPTQFALNGVIPCWTEGVQRMKVGGKSQLICPSGIAYGDRGHPPTIPGGATLIFEIELLEIPAAK